MNKEHHLLVINVGSTSTKVGWFSGRDHAVLETIRYSSEALASYKSIGEQLPRREDDILKFLARNGISLKEIDMIVSRGGLGKPAPAGAYMIDERHVQGSPGRQIRNASFCPGAGHGP